MQGIVRYTYFYVAKSVCERHQKKSRSFCIKRTLQDFCRVNIIYGTSAHLFFLSATRKRIDEFVSLLAVGKGIAYIVRGIGKDFALRCCLSFGVLLLYRRSASNCNQAYFFGLRSRAAFEFRRFYNEKIREKFCWENL